MQAVRLPRLMDAGFTALGRLRPSKLAVTDNLTPLSTATMTLPDGETLADVRQWAELYGPLGSYGYYRVKATGTGYGKEQKLTLEHGLVTLRDEVTPADVELTGTKRQIMAALLQYQVTIRWQLGNVPDTGSHTLKVNKVKVLQALISALSLFAGDDLGAAAYGLTYDFSTTPWTLNLETLETIPSCECRLSRNMGDGITVNRDDGDLYTRVYAAPLPDGYLDGDTVEQWGVIGQPLNIADDADPAEALAYAQSCLKNHENPTVAIEISALELSRQTGESLDAFVKGKLCRVALPEYGVTLNERIVSVKPENVMGNPQKVRLSLCNTVKDMSGSLSRLEDSAADLEREATSLGSGLRGLGGKVAANKEEATTLITELESEILLRAWAKDLTALEERTNVVEIDLDAKTATISLMAQVQNDQGAAISQAEISINGLDAEIGLRVEKDGVIAAINLTPESATIKASRINLQGYVTASSLSAEMASMKNAMSQHLNTYKIDATIGNIGSLTASSLSVAGFNYGNENIGKSSLSVCTGVHYNKSYATIPSSTGTNYVVIASVSVWGDYETIDYLSH